MNLRVLVFCSLICVLSLFSSCNDDEVFIVPTEEYIIGDWRMTSVVLASGNRFEPTSTVTYSGRSEEIDYTLSFSDDPKTVHLAGSITMRYVSDVDGSIQTFKGYNSADIVPSSWSLDGTTIEIIEQGEAFIFGELRNVTESSFEIVVDGSEGTPTANYLGYAGTETVYTIERQ